MSSGRLHEFRVVVGALTMPKGHEASRKKFKTNQRHLHPRYDMVFLDNDIALLQLPTSIEYNVCKCKCSPMAWLLPKCPSACMLCLILAVVKPVSLPTYGAAAADLAGTEARVSGWGKTADVAANAPSHVLKFTTLKVLPNDECEHVYGNTMLGNKLCLSAEGGHSVCQVGPE